MIGILSYLNDNEDTRILRLTNHKKQLVWLREIFATEPILIVAQNYREEDYITDINNLVYLKYSEPLGSSSARNVILNKFYNSDDDILFILDDDVKSYDYYDSKQLIYDFYFGKYKEPIDILVPLPPEWKPFKKFIYEKCDYTHYHTLKRASINCWPGMWFMKNFKKLYGKEIYSLDSKINNQFDIHSSKSLNSDIELFANCVMNDFTMYMCMNWIKKSLACDVSVLFGADTISGQQSNDVHKKFVNNTNIALKERYGKDIKEINRYNKAKDYLILARPYTYILEENLIPTYKKETKNTLF